MSDSQLSFATLGSPIGYVSKLSGTATVQSIDGQDRLVNIGDPIFFAETVVTSRSGSITIVFIDHTEIVIGPDAIVEMTEEVFNIVDLDTLSQDSRADIDALQQAIAEGVDPTTIQEAPAAGEEVIGDEQHRVDVTVSRNSDASLPDYGFDSSDDYLSNLPYYGYDSSGEALPSISGPEFSSLATITSAFTSAPTTGFNVDQPLEVKLDINPITNDGLLNALEADGDVLVTGSVTGDAFDSGVVTLVVNGVSYVGEVSDGTFSIGVAGADLVADSDNVLAGSLVVSNKGGQQGSATSVEQYLVDTTTRATIRVNAITSDDVISSQESSETITVTGRVGFDASVGDTVSMEINGVTYTTTVIDDRSWSADVAGSDLAQGTSFVASVTGQDSSGNPFTASTTSTYTLDLAATAGAVSVNAITSDDVINGAESNQATITVTGSAAGGDIAAGDVVTLEINGTSYTTTVDAGGTWSVDVAGNDLVADTVFDVVVTSSDAAGNTVTSTGSSTHTVDISADAGTVSIDKITSDDVINKAESGQTITVTGTASGGDISSSDVVTLVINGTTYTTRVETDGTWSADVAGSDLAADTAFDAVVTSSDAAGNRITTTTTSTHGVDLTAFGNIAVNQVTDDKYINAEEAAAGNKVAITGFVGGAARPGDALTVSVAGVDIGTGVVSEEQDANGYYLYSVEALGSGLDTGKTSNVVTVTVSGEDEAGNPFSTSSTQSYFVDTAAEADVDAYGGDGWGDTSIGVDDVGNVTIETWLHSGGSISSIRITDSEGKILTMTEGITKTSDDGQGGWATFEKSADVSTLADGELQILVNFVDNHGNVGSAESFDILTKDVSAASGVIVSTSDDNLRGAEGNSSDYIDGKGGNDILIGNDGPDTLIGADGNDLLIGGMFNQDDGDVDTLTGGAGEDIFIIHKSGSVDLLTDFNAKDDRLDLTDLLTGIAGNPGSDAGTDAIADFLSAHITVTDQNVEIDGQAVASFGEDSNFDSDMSGFVDSLDSIKVIFNDQEYSIHIDG
ncbi:retention module-containing protein [Marinomonas transparens]|uniref:Retention module-containing protein n=1 Tax=Marinomonas transparens TaxID=2795388 RepID=A0A934JX17_9GAMM|nr:retention module-containing protein [Marinomonas transparens]MBJ7538789.1 retention module-containing protein [Marinomonas transparens]